MDTPTTSARCLYVSICKHGDDVKYGVILDKYDTYRISIEYS